MDRDLLKHKYFNGTLTNQEITILKQLLDNDPEFKADFDLEKNHHDIIINNSNNVPEKSELSPSFLRYAIAASIVIGLSVFGSKYFIDTTNFDDIFDQNFEVYQNSIKPIKEGSGLETVQEEAFFKYEIKEYKGAIEAFQTEFSKSQESYYLFYIANSYLAIGDTKQAITYLEKHQKFKDDFYEKSRWYLALAHVKDKNKSKGIPLLNEISKSEDYHHKEAKVLLKAIH